MPGGKEICRHLLPHGVDEHEDLPVAPRAGVPQEPLAPERVERNGCAIPGNEGFDGACGLLVHGFTVSGAEIVSTTPSIVIVVPGFNGTARPGGTSVSSPPGKTACHGTVDWLRIPAAPGMAGCGTTVPTIAEPSSFAGESEMCRRRIVVPGERAIVTSPDGRWIMQEGWRRDR